MGNGNIEVSDWHHALYALLQGMWQPLHSWAAKAEGEMGTWEGSKVAQVEGKLGSDQFEQVAESAITVLTAGLKWRN